MRKTITVILPAFNEADSIGLLEKKMIALATQNDGYIWQFLIVDDGSTDATLKQLKHLSGQDSRFQYLSLSRNFGKENAVLAGLDHARGDAVIIMDSDMQHPIDVVPQMLRCWEDGAKNVFARRRTSRESWFKRGTSKLYYRLLNSFSEVNIDLDAGDFRLLDRQCVKALRGIREQDRNNKSLFCWIGYDKEAVEYDQLERTTGTTKFSASSLFKLALDGFTSISNAPLKIIAVITGIFAFTGLLLLAIITYKVLNDVTVPPLLSISCVISWAAFLQCVCICLIGLYVERIFNASRQRPNYLIKENSSGIG